MELKLVGLTCRFSFKMIIKNIFSFYDLPLKRQIFLILVGFFQKMTLTHFPVYMFKSSFIFIMHFYSCEFQNSNYFDFKVYL